MSQIMNRKISGYASLFSSTDLGGDMIMAGAFRASLAKQQPRDIKMLYQHDITRPIGQWLNIRETEKGLWVEGQLTEHVQLADETLALIADGVLDGLSIGFRTIRAKASKGHIKRRLIEIQLVEISLVTFPMQPDARLKKSAASSQTITELRCAGARMRELAG
ncbi:MAG: HK97 family phage prohead protease [Parvibaculales bacterium]